MKKILLTLVAALVVTSASAFSFNWGITGGLNYTKVKVSSKTSAFSQLKSGDSQAGWNIGVRANVGLIAGFSVNGALLYNESAQVAAGSPKAINVANLPAGVYILKVVANEGVATYPVIKK